MSKRLGVLPLLLAALVSGAAVPAPAAAASGSATTSVQHAGVLAVRGFGSRSFGRRSPAVGSRYRSPYYRRVSPFHGFGGAILKGLGIAYLFHMLFGIGAGGGSPFGLILLVAL